MERHIEVDVRVLLEEAMATIATQQKALHAMREKLAHAYEDNLAYKADLQTIVNAFDLVRSKSGGTTIGIMSLIKNINKLSPAFEPVLEVIERRTPKN